MLRRGAAHVRRQAVAYLALFVALTGTAIAAGPSITGGNVRDGTLSGLDVGDGSLSSIDVKNGSLTGADVKFGSLDGTDVRNSGLTGSDVRDRALGTKDLRRGAVTGAEVKDETLNGADVADESLTSADVTNGSLTARDFKPGELTRPTTAPGPAPRAAVFAFVRADGDIGPARTRGVTDRAITHPGRGVYCVLAGRGVSARSVVVSSARPDARQVVSAVPFVPAQRERRCAGARVVAIISVRTAAGAAADGPFIAWFAR